MLKLGQSINQSIDNFKHSIIPFIIKRREKESPNCSLLLLFFFSIKVTSFPSISDLIRSFFPFFPSGKV